MMNVTDLFNAHARAYEAPRRRLIPPFESFYGTAVGALALAGEPLGRVLDLGAGTGMLAGFVLAAHPDVELTLLDGAAAMLDEARAAAAGAAADRSCSLAEEQIWRIEPIAFDPRLVDAAREAVGTGRAFASGALHDAAEMARHVPTAMVFSSSTRGLSHTSEEDTPEPDLERAIAGYADVALKLIGGGLV